MLVEEYQTAINHGKWVNTLRIARNHYDRNFASALDQVSQDRWAQLATDAAKQFSNPGGTIPIASIPSEIVARSPVFEDLVQARDDGPEAGRTSEKNVKRREKSDVESSTRKSFF